MARKARQNYPPQTEWGEWGEWDYPSPWDQWDGPWGGPHYGYPDYGMDGMEHPLMRKMYRLMRRMYRMLRELYEREMDGMDMGEMEMDDRSEDEQE